MRIIRNQRISESPWRHVPEGSLANGDWTNSRDPIIVALADWRQNKTELLRRDAPIGVRLKAGDDVEDIAGDLNVIALVALAFESVTEGRGYTHARLLRERYRYQGEIRAIGNVSRDRLAFMERCGFDAYELGEDCDLRDALKAFGEISLVYQPAADERPAIPSQRA